MESVTCHTLFVLGSTLLRHHFDHSSTSLWSLVLLSLYCDGAPFDHLSYSLRTVIVLCSLLYLLYSHRTIIHTSPWMQQCHELEQPNNYCPQYMCFVHRRDLRGCSCSRSCCMHARVPQEGRYCTTYGRRTDCTYVELVPHVGSSTGSTVVGNINFRLTLARELTSKK
jgi:hypothetical protein